MKHLTLLVGCLIFLTTSSIQSFAQQSSATKTDSVSDTIAEPIKVTAFTLRTGKNQPGRSALGIGDWITQPVVQVENISGKAIKYLVVEISLPSVKSGSTSRPFMLAYGQLPGTKPSSKPIETLQPGARIDLTVDQNACEAVKSHLLANSNPPAGSRVKTRINGVVFANRTAWIDGLMHVADPNDPLRWNVASENQTQADLSMDVSTFKFAPVSYLSGPHRPLNGPCWKRLGTQWVDCCGGLQAASAIMVQVWGGIFEPLIMSFDCGDGTYCEYVKQVGCSSDPEGDPGGGAY
ncbi:MAG TPA: hypothetical protein VGO68_14015 [Pyrinomonadaceae bacterium]|nr:hypothetical protein [Pyrinomonadaceae bacterium]